MSISLRMRWMTHSDTHDTGRVGAIPTSKNGPRGLLTKAKIRQNKPGVR